MKKIVLLILVALFGFTLVACGAEEKEATAYGVVHKDYVGMATVKVKGTKITSVVIDEAFTPCTWAQLSNVAPTSLEGAEVVTYPDDVLVIAGELSTTFYAKYISINGELYTGTVRSENLVVDGVTYTREPIKYSKEGVEDYHKALIESPTRCEEYIKAVKENKALIVTASGTLSSYTSANTYGWFKSEGKYWSGESYPLGWKGNVNAFIEYLNGKELKDIASDKFVKDAEADATTGLKYWTIDGIKTGATFTDVKDYYKVVYEAYTAAINK